MLFNSINSIHHDAVTASPVLLCPRRRRRARPPPPRQHRGNDGPGHPPHDILIMYHRRRSNPPGSSPSYNNGRYVSPRGHGEHHQAHVRLYHLVVGPLQIHHVDVPHRGLRPIRPPGHSASQNLGYVPASHLSQSHHLGGLSPGVPDRV